MKPKEQEMTVVGVCRCGCDDTLVVLVHASNSLEAAHKAMVKAKEIGTVYAVFKGVLANHLPFAIKNR